MQLQGTFTTAAVRPVSSNVLDRYSDRLLKVTRGGLYRLPANDPAVAVFGPSTFRLANGTTQPNPLATRNRYIFKDRGTGQSQAPAIHTVGLKVGKTIKLGGTRQVEVAGNIFNLLNGGAFTQFSYNSAYQTWSSNFLQMRNRQQAQAFQLTTVFRF